MKIKSLIIPLAFTLLLSAGCTKTTDKKANDNKTSTVTEDKKETEKTDVVTMPSRAADEKNLFRALDESWIVIVENDITTTKDVVLNTGFEKTDEKNSSKKVNTPRVLVLCTKDANQKIDKNFTLTTPKVTIKDEGAKIEGGVLKGDLYIDAKNVILEFTKIEGNIYFSTKEAKDSIVMKDSTVTGTMEVK